MRKVLGIVEVSQTLVNLIRKMKQNCNGLSRITVFESAGLERWKGVGSYDGSKFWDMWPEWIAHAIYMKALRSLSSEYQPVSFFRVSLRSGSSQRNFSLTIALEEKEYAEIRYGGKIMDPNEYSNICFDILVANIMMETRGSGFHSGDFSDGYWTRQKRAALDRMGRYEDTPVMEDRRTFRSFEVDPGIAKGVFRHSKTKKTYFLSQRPPVAIEGDYYMDYDDAGAWVWTTKWEQLCVNTDSESLSSTLTPCDKRAFEKAYKEARESPDGREVSGLTERIEVVGGPLPELPKAEPICPECHGTGEVLNFHQYHPCPRGCKKP